MDNVMVLTLAPVFTVAIAAFSCWISFRGVVISRNTFRTQTQPKIIVYTHVNDDSDSLFMIRIHNIGKDVAEKVTFEIEHPIPRAMGIHPDRAQDPSDIEDGPIVNGIPSLAPGEFRDIIWGQYGGLIKATHCRPIEVNYRYCFGNEPLSGSSILEVGSYVGTLVNKPHMKEIVKHLGKIDKSSEKTAKHLGDISGALKKDNSPE